MSFIMRAGSGATRESPFNGIVRRMVNLPRGILDGVSRVMWQGMDLMGVGERIYQQPQPNFPWQYYQNFPMQYPQQPPMIPEEWTFLSTYEQQYGTIHPFFYACRFFEALRMAQKEFKFLFMYIHSPEHPFIPPFCAETLGSEFVIQFLDANFISWGGIANKGEGLLMASTLGASSFPFCALVAPAPGDNIAVLQQLEGPVSPAELVEILQRTMEEQGRAFASGLLMEDYRRREDSQLREEQNAAYLAALKVDQEKEQLTKRNQEKSPQEPTKSINQATYKKQQRSPLKSQSSKLEKVTNSGDTQIKEISIKGKNAQVTQVEKATNSGDTQMKQISIGGKNAQVTQLLIRFPNGEKREHTFLSTDKIQAIFRFIDSLGLLGIGNYRLVSSFPRKIYGADQMGMTLKEADILPKAGLFVELL